MIAFRRAPVEMPAASGIRRPAATTGGRTRAEDVPTRAAERADLG
jgi:hypothetical protein